ncbi:MAG: WD40/YVTN/BNR-like repeat-containing protein, partial [Acidobacteriota bacterium]
MSSQQSIVLILYFLLLLSPLARAETYDVSLYRALAWRSIGPYRGGRATAVAGVANRPLVYYMGASGGGVWKTEDGGLTWQPISDGYFNTGSVGAIAVAPSDPNVIYVGMGEACIRSNFSHGDGVYKSVDGGQSWTHVGLGDSRQIGRIRIHPQNADCVYVAALGSPFGPSEERGVFRSRDGGKSWERILHLDQVTGAVDIDLDPNNPGVLYAGLWQVSRKPWGIFSGGPGSGLYRSRDGGDSWAKLEEGLPHGIKGRIGVSVSPARAGRVWAIIEAEEGGVFRSDDGGQRWLRVNSESKLRERAWYYSHIYADPQDADTVYVLTLLLFKSIDAGQSFEPIRTSHSDNHDLWIAPEDPSRMINSNDGGANVSLNGGDTWTKQDNQPTGQFYHVITDDQFPYRVYGAQQDNTTVSIPSRTTGFGIGRTDWYPVGGGESGYIAPDPEDPNIVYAGSFYGLLTRYDHHIRLSRNISVWPVTPGGRPASDVKYRFQWTFPIAISPHDPDTLYVGANVLFRSTNEGQSWEPISPDLTRNDKTKQGYVGGPLTGDNSSADYYDTIFTVAESPLQKQLIWVGTDDGLVHVTRDGGRNWQNVTPKDMLEWSRVSLIEASPHDEATAYLAVNRYQLDDLKPYIYRTSDQGKSWQVITEGIPEGAFVRAVRDDPRRRGLLY